LWDEVVEEEGAVDGNNRLQKGKDEESIGSFR
jgi:hypothetical protein